MSRVDYSRFEKDKLKWAMESNEIREAFQPLKSMVNSIESTRSSLYFSSKALSKRITDEIQRLTNVKRDLEIKRESLNFKRNNMPKTQKVTHEDGSTSTEPVNQDIINSLNQEIDAINKQISQLIKIIGRLYEIWQKCERILSHMSLRQQEISDAHSGIYYVNSKFEQTCATVKDKIERAARIMERYLGENVHNEAGSGSLGHIPPKR